MRDVFNRIQRELPDTDKDRYDTAYQRGQAQARSGLLLGGLAFGALVGAALMYLFDPNRGTGRRAELASRATGLRNDLARTASGRVEDVQNRARGAVIEAGLRNPDEGVPARSAARGDDRGTTASNGTARVGLAADDDAPGAHVADPITPEEVALFGASGPVAGAALAVDEDADAWEAAERDARRASEGRAAG
jgi:hypothetical protein